MLRIALLAGLLSASISLNLSAQQVARTLEGVSPRVYQTSQVQVNEASAVAASYIVQFDGLPQLVQQKIGNKNAALDVQSIQATFESDLRGIASTMSLPKGTLEIQEVYSSVFNGVLIKATSGSLTEIRKLPYVVNIVADGVMTAPHIDVAKSAVAHGIGHAQLNTKSDSSDKRGASLPARANAEYTGAGVVVAVIDSGVDYTHPDLATGYLGGYDFVNEDADPMDDNGHGTHVAGIVAGNGAAFKGTAPDVQFLALKVLDAAGKGFDSAVIRAIEHAVNPDGDPSTSDAVDIINLSISSLETGMADHPVTIAVENATAAGVVCVVAAGNRGEEGRASITAPGNATSAITVGAMDEFEGVAAFSSRGPSGSISAFSRPFFGLKPDILAPGVQIKSTWLSGAYESRDGTSMASPYVAGLVAQVIQQFPSWNPMTIKAHLMQRSRDVGGSIWDQGAGIVDDSRQVSYVVSPACMDFGLVYSSQSSWVRSEVLTITNFGTAPSTYAINVRDALPEGIQTSLSTVAEELQPGESAEIRLDVTVNPGQLRSSSFPDGYVGYVDVSDASGIVTIPFSLFKTETAHIQFPQNADHVVLQSQAAENVHIHVDEPDILSLFVPPGEYDILVQFENGRYTIIKEEIDLESASFNEIRKEDAPYPVTLQALDVNANLLSPLAYEVFIQGRSKDWMVSNYIDLSETDDEPTFYVSSISDSYSINYNVSAFSDSDAFYDISFSLPSEVSGTVLLQNEVHTLTRFTYEYTLPSGIDQAYFVPWNTRDAEFTSIRHNELTSLKHPGYVLVPPFTKDFYSSRSVEAVSRGYGHSIVFPGSGRSKKLRDQHTLLRSAPVIFNGNEPVLRVNNKVRPLQQAEEGGFMLRPGGGNGYWAGTLDNSATRLRIQGPQGGGLFRGAWGEAFQSHGEWILLKDGVIQDYETVEYNPKVVQEDDEQFLVERIVDPGAYTVIIRNDAFLANIGEQGHAVELNFQTDRADPDPPRINALYGSLSRDGEEALAVDVTDVCNWCSIEEAREQLKSVELWVKRSISDDWVEKPLMQEDSLYIAVFSGASSEGYHALRLRAEDEFGNSMDYYTIDESTYSVSDPRAVGLDEQGVIPSDLSIASLYPNPSPGPVRFSYTLPDPADVQIFVYDMLGRNVMQIDRHQAAGMHEHLLDFNPFANGLYTIQLRVGEFSEARQVLKIQ